LAIIIKLSQGARSSECQIANTYFSVI